MTTISEEILTISILHDTPVDNDLFEGNGHNRSAKVLADSMILLKDRDGAIGLEGEWGAGKSTVINIANSLVQEKITEKNEDVEFKVFTMDLWKHQTDNFRRAFLESLLLWSKSNSNVSKGIISEYQDTIRDRIKRIQFDNNKTYSFLGIFALLTVPFLPLIYTWLSPFGFSNSISIQKNYLFGFSLPQLLCIGFILLLYVSVIIRFIKLYYIDNKKRTFIQALSKSVSIFTKDVEKESITQNIREDDPTTYEFTSIFRSLITEIQKNKVRVVFVLDNIDRLPPSCIPDLWSEIRSLFTSEYSLDNKKNSYVTIVIPYDKKYVLRAFSSNNGNQKTDNKYLEEDLIRKTFDRVIRVAPPISSDWRSFFNIKLNEAVAPNINDTIKYRLYKILDYYFQTQSIHPTPRKIISYINEIGALLLQWDKIISIESIALYVIYREKIEQDPSAITSDTLVNSRYLRISNIYDWRKDFASLSFNVDPEHAYQVLLGQDIALAITSDKAEKLNNLMTIMGFNNVLSDVIDENISDWANEDPSIVSNVAKNLSQLEIKGEHTHHIWRTLASNIDNLASPEANDLEKYSNLAIIIEHQEQNNIVDISISLINWLTTVHTNKDAANRTFELGFSFLKQINNIIDILNSYAHEDTTDLLVNRYILPKGIESYIGAACAAYNNKNYEFYKIKHFNDLDLVVAGIDELFKTKPIEAGKIIHSIYKNLETKNINTLLTTLNNRISTIDFDDEERSILISAYCKLLKKMSLEEIKTQCISIVNDNSLVFQAHRAYIETDYDTYLNSKWIIFCVLGNEIKFIPAIHPQFGDVSESITWFEKSINIDKPEDDEVEALSEHISEEEHFNEWLMFCLKDKTDSSYYTIIFKEVLIKSKFNSLTIKPVIDNYNKLVNILDDDLRDNFYIYFSRWEKYVLEKYSDEHCVNLSTQFIEDLSKNKTVFIDLNTNIDTYLKSISKDSWLNSLTTEDSLLRTLITRLKYTKLYLPISAYKTALLSHACSILKGEIKAKSYSCDWNLLTNALKTQTRKQLAAEIMTSMSSINTTTDGVKEFISLYPTLSENLTLTENADLALDKFISKIIIEPSDIFSNYIDNNKSKITKCIKSASSDSQSLLMESIESIDKSANEDIINWLMFLSKSLNLKIPTGQALENEETNSDKD